MFLNLKVPHFNSASLILGYLFLLILNLFLPQIQVFQIPVLVLHATHEQRILILDLLDQLIIIYVIQRVPRDLLRPVGVDTLKLVLVALTDILALLELASDFQQLLDQLGLADLQAVTSPKELL